MKKRSGKEKQKVSKPIRLAAYSYLVFLAASFLLGIFSGILPYVVSSVFYVVGILLIFFIYKGFVIIGKKLKSNFLVIISWIGILIGILYFLYIALGGFLIDIPQISEQDIESFQTQDPSGEVDSDHPVYKLLIFGLVSYLVTSIVLGTLSILFGVALFKLRKKISYAGATGILNIVAGATLVIFIGYLIMIPAAIMEVILLFEASRRFEK